MASGETTGALNHAVDFYVLLGAVKHQFVPHWWNSSNLSVYNVSVYILDGIESRHM